MNAAKLMVIGSVLATIVVAIDQMSEPITWNALPLIIFILSPYLYLWRAVNAQGDNVYQNVMLTIGVVLIAPCGVLLLLSCLYWSSLDAQTPLIWAVLPAYQWLVILIIDALRRLSIRP